MTAGWLVAEVLDLNVLRLSFDRAPAPRPGRRSAGGGRGRVPYHCTVARPRTRWSVPPDASCRWNTGLSRRSASMPSCRLRRRRAGIQNLPRNARSGRGHRRRAGQQRWNRRRCPPVARLTPVARTGRQEFRPPVRCRRSARLIHGRAHESNNRSLLSRQDRRSPQGCRLESHGRRERQFEHTLPDGSRADYALGDRSGRPVATVEAKRASINPIAAQDQGRHYAARLGVPCFCRTARRSGSSTAKTDAHARKIATFYSPDDLERRIAARRNRLELSGVEIDRRIVDREYQIACIEALSMEVSQGRRKLLVEMATGTGKTRTAAAFVKRLLKRRVRSPA